MTGGLERLDLLAIASLGDRPDQGLLAVSRQRQCGLRRRGLGGLVEDQRIGLHAAAAPWSPFSAAMLAA